MSCPIQDFPAVDSYRLCMAVVSQHVINTTVADNPEKLNIQLTTQKLYVLYHILNKNTKYTYIYSIFINICHRKMHVAAFYEYSEYIYSINCYYIHCMAIIIRIFLFRKEIAYSCGTKKAPPACVRESLRLAFSVYEL